MTTQEEREHGDGILSRHSEPAPRPVRRRIGLAVLLLVAALTGWAVAKHVTTGGLSDAKIAQGLREMGHGIAGEPEGFDRAEEAFVDAASVSVVDPYPAFLLRANRRVRAGGGEDGLHERVAAAVASGEFDLARERAQEFSGDQQRAGKYWARLVDELEAVDRGDPLN